MATGRGRRRAGRQWALALVTVGSAVAVALCAWLLLPHLSRGSALAAAGPPAASAGPRCDATDTSGCIWFSPAASMPKAGIRPVRPAGCTGACTSPPASCDVTCQQQWLVWRNSQVILPKPAETPAITQQQLDQRRKDAEASDSPAVASEPPYSPPGPTPVPSPAPTPSPAPAPSATTAS